MVKSGSPSVNQGKYLGKDGSTAKSEAFASKP